MLHRTTYILSKLPQFRLGVISMAQHHTSGSENRRKVAVVLSGCGVFDGTEIHEASAVLVHLSRENADVAIFAPDIEQMHVVNHATGQPVEGETRNVLAESARIARGKISALCSLDVTSHDAVVFPGGFGAAKNLSTVATDGPKCTVNPEVERVIKQFHAAHKPIGLCCIAPTIAAKLIPGCEVTVGHDTDDGGMWPYASTAGAIGQMGSKHINKNVTEVHVDSTHKIVTTPAFMCETHVHEVYDGIGEMIKTVLRLAK